MLVFVEGGKPENLEKNLGSKLNPHMAPGWSQTQVTLIGERALMTASSMLDVLNFECDVPSNFHIPSTETHLAALGTAGIAQYQNK